MSEKVSTSTEFLSSEEKYLIWEWFNKVKKDLIDELKIKLTTEKDINKKLLLNKYIRKIKSLSNNIIKFSKEKKLINAETYLSNGSTYKIVFYNNNLSYQTNVWLELLLYHELQHYLLRDKQWNIDINKNTRELNAKLLSFRYYLIKNNYEISKDSINKIFIKIKKERESNSNNWKQKYNFFDQIQETEFFWIYENFKDNKDNKEDLLFYLQNLVKLEELKKETQNT